MQKPKPSTHRLPFFLHLILWGGFFTIIWNKQLVVAPDGIFAGSRTTWGDAAAHLSYMSAFAYRSSFPTTHPLFINHPFSYAFAADFLGGLLVRSGLSLVTSYNLLGLILSFALIYLLFIFFTNWWQDHWVALLASSIFLLSGGLGFWYLLEDILLDGLIPTLAHLPREYTFLVTKNIHWINIITSQIIPQRSFLLGFPIGLLIIILTHKALTTHSRYSRWLLLAAGFLLGLMPLIHPHSLIALAVIIIWWLGKDLLTKPSLWLSWLWFIIPALFLGSFTFTQVISPAVNHSFFRFQPGWLALKNTAGLAYGQSFLNFLWFWLKNWGVLPLIAVFGLKFTPRSTRQLIPPFILLWLAANLWLFQPWEWDNTKILTWVYLLVSGLAAATIISLWRHPFPGTKVVALILVLAVTASGLLDSLKLLQVSPQEFPFLGQEEIKLAALVRQTTDPNAIFLTSDQHNHWIPVLTGRQILMGFRGWLWSYGIDYSQREKDVTAMFQGGQTAKDLLTRYHVDYVVIGPSESVAFKANQPWFASQYSLIFTTPHYQVYRLN